MTTTGILLHLGFCLISQRTSVPSNFGNLMSKMTKSGCEISNRSNASNPSRATSTSIPSCSKRKRRSSMIAVSSSTMRTRFPDKPNHPLSVFMSQYHGAPKAICLCHISPPIFKLWKRVQGLQVYDGGRPPSVTLLCR